MLTDGLQWCGLLWCFYQLFGLSFWRSLIDPIQWMGAKWCNAKFLQICFNYETHLHLGWAQCESVFSTFAFLAEVFFWLWTVMKMINVCNWTGGIMGSWTGWSQRSVCFRPGRLAATLSERVTADTALLCCLSLAWPTQSVISGVCLSRL